MFADDEAKLARMLADLERVRRLLHDTELQGEHVDKRPPRSEYQPPCKHVPDNSNGR